MQRDLAGGLVLNLVRNGEQIVGIDRDGASEDEPLPIVPDQCHRRGWRQRRVSLGAPHRVATGHREGHAAPRHPPVLCVIGVRRAGGREELDVGRLRIDRLVIFGQHQIIDPPARKRNRAAQARRLDAHARGGLDRRGARRSRRQRSCRGHRGARLRGCARGGDRSRFQRARLLLDLALLLLNALPALLVFLQLGAGIEHLPDQQHAHRQHDGEKEVLLVVLVHGPFSASCLAS